MTDQLPGPPPVATDTAIEQFLDAIGSGANTNHRDLVRRMMRTVVQLDRDPLDRLDLKIIERALRELHKGFLTFAPWRASRKIAMFGSARSREDSAEYLNAVECAKRLVEAGFMVVTGAGPGIMQAGNEGAGRENSFGVNIDLPFEQSANRFIDGDAKLVGFKYFFTRKVVFVKEVDGVILYPGGFGTQDEGFETLTLIQTGKSEPQPIVMIDPPGSTYWAEWDRYVRSALLGRGLISVDDLDLYKITSSVEEAVEHIRAFYANFHSIRYVKNMLVLRLQHATDEALLARLNRDFRDIIVEGDIQPCGMHSWERDEPGTADLHRLSFRFDQRHLGRLRQLIDVLNSNLTEQQKLSGTRFPPARGVIPGVYPGNNDADEK